MSTIIAPLPSGTGVNAIAEHRPRRDRDHHAQGEDDSPAGDRPEDERQHPPAPPRPEAAAAPAEDPTMPAEMLFAAALLANDLPHPPPSPDELRLRGSQGWTPPDSVLRLKDKLI